MQTLQDQFTARYTELLRTLLTASTPRDVLLRYSEDLPAWDKAFLQTLRCIEIAAKKGTLRAPPAPAALASAKESHEEHKGQKSNGDVLRVEKAAVGPGGRRIVSSKGKKGKSATSSNESAPEPGVATKKTPAKEARKWGTNSEPVHDADLAALDFSGAGSAHGDVDLRQWIDESKLGHTRSDGVYELADDEIMENDADGKDDAASGFFGMLWRSAPASGFSLARLTGARDALTKDDLAPVLHLMQMHLQSKNVANDVAEMICSGVEKRLLGQRLSSFGSVRAEVRKFLEESITRILTPSTSTDILLEIAAKKQRRAELLEALPAHAVRSAASPALNPYAIGFVGVNGVGKSTNLAKVCFWLLQNRYRVLIAACDTFRSGAVEQLRTHVRNLGALTIDGRCVADGLENGDSILELYERGYGKDAAGIAKDALAYARSQGFDVVLIDTAGRMQDNEPLMRALAKLIAVNQPDKVLFVGEALVGNEAVDQLTKFNRALKDYSGVSNPRGLDGCLLTKWDTVDDKVGTALTSTWATGLPIFFVGTGQTYTDLRQLRVHHVVNALLR